MASNDWHLRFLDLAELVSGWSKDPSTRCGAVIVRPDKTVASVGFNGFPKGCSDSKKYYEDRELKYARVIHAEVNAILHAREPLTDYTMYTHQTPMIGPSCDRCSAHVIQSGITTVVTRTYDTPERYKDSIQRGLEMYDEAYVRVMTLG